MKIRWNRVIGWLLIIVGFAGSLALVIKKDLSYTENFAMLIAHGSFILCGMWFLED